MDQGIIDNLTRHYKKLLLCRRLEAIDEGKEFNFKLLDAIYVATAFLETGTVLRRPNSLKRRSQTETHDTKLIEIWEALPNGEIELSDFLEADKRFETGGSFILEEIAEEMLCSEESTEGEDDDITVEEQVISFEEAKRNWSTVQDFM
ncbi:hypothetical protein RF11_13304 [Thelohanellus kitauei]|uniref:DDE-1 domain-containing protein n=1 Tax=Thelohanellus kitauei TaxID=669202 RepID=A0A0C2NK18_THEKT|nr:hypothetical protein RF11_13304 [Thelohanellus kitauei]